MRLLEQLSRERSWRPPRFENDRVVWGPADAEARASQAPRCSTGDKKQLAALVALRSLDPDAVSTAVTRPASGAPAPPPPETLLAAAAGDATGDCVPPGKLPPPPARDATGGRVLDVAIAICGGDANAGRRRDRGGREMTGQEVDRLKGRVVGRTVTWGNCEGVVEDVTLVGADALSLSGFSGLDVKVATYFRLRGDGDRWGVRAAAKALGEGVISELAALALTGGADAAAVEALRARAAPPALEAELVVRRPLDYQSFPCLVVRQSRKQKVPDNVPVELASLVGA